MRPELGFMNKIIFTNGRKEMIDLLKNLKGSGRRVLKCYFIPRFLDDLNSGNKIMTS